MAATTHPVEVRVEQLLGREVVDANGQRIGHIEEIIAEPDGSELLVKEFHVGRAALAERISAHGIAMTFLGLFGAHRKTKKPHRINWSDLDLSDPKHPRLKK
jgi:sporulation protein YlmC with PRC-barrel domain